MAPFIKMARSQSALSPRRIYRLAACVPSQKQTHSSPPAHMLPQKGFAYGPARLGGSYSSLRGIIWTKLSTRVQIVSVVHAGKQQRTCDVLIAWGVSFLQGEPQQWRRAPSWSHSGFRGGIAKLDFAQHTTPWFTDITYSNARQKVLA